MKFVEETKQVALEILSSQKKTQAYITSENVKIKCGIFQGDLLFPLLFFLALVPFYYELNETGYWQLIYESKINHLFYMDDLKLHRKMLKNFRGYSIR